MKRHAENLCILYLYFICEKVSQPSELESTLLAADKPNPNPEAKHVAAPGLHLLHVLPKLGGKRLSEGRFHTSFI